MKSVKIKRRAAIRIASFLAAVLAVLILSCALLALEKNRARELLSIANERSLASLASYVDTLENDLRKLQYVSGAPMTTSLTLSLSRASAGAKLCLSQLSSGGNQLAAVNKFLSQAGDYVAYINKKTSNGEALRESDGEQIKQLYGYARKISDKLSFLEECMLAGSLDFEDAQSTLASLSGEDSLLSYFEQSADIENTFEDYPTLIYDGPFADSLLNKTSELLQDSQEISIARAKELAAEYSGTDERELIDGEELTGKAEAYTFYGDGVSVAVTKRGGYLLYLLCDGYAGEERISVSEAMDKAREYLEKCSYTSMADSYYYKSDGICTVNFAYTVDDAICYADLIKVGIALDTGEIVSVDASGYIMNHIRRSLPSANLTQSGAAENISELLTVKKSGRAVIPTEDGKEVYAFEYLCTDGEGNDVLVYIDALTGKEADVKLLLYADDGILTR